jgi:NAD(P)H-hydrate repair Nnr-like enzyme with NAD(P)H-hydrate dehydratase domain
MSWLIVGTVPYRDFPLLDVECSESNGLLRLGSESVPIARGTPALIATACMVADVIGIERPRALLAGDIGRGDGSRKVYDRLVRTMADRGEGLLVFHYLQPELDWHNRILMKIEVLDQAPTLVADAGFMYVAKMSGFSSSYDLFTPDVGELAFLADESAPHPFYTRGFLLQEEEGVPQLIARAYEHQNAARFLLVKGACDYVASSSGILGKVCEPCVEAMEPIGGTGDSLTGIVSTLVASGVPIDDAALTAARINRVLGLIANPNPASSIANLLPSLPAAIEAVQSRNTPESSSTSV